MHRHRGDMVLLAHIRDQHRSSLGSYGRPGRTEELNELGVRRVGHRPVRAIEGMHSPHGQGQPILFARLPEDPENPWPRGVDERQGKL